MSNYAWTIYVLSKATKFRKLITWVTDVKIWNRKFRQKVCHSDFRISSFHVGWRRWWLQSTLSVWPKQHQACSSDGFTSKKGHSSNCPGYKKLQEIEIYWVQIDYFHGCVAYLGIVQNFTLNVTFLRLWRKKVALRCWLVNLWWTELINRCKQQLQWW